MRLVSYNKPEIPYAIVGVAACAVAGTMFPFFSFVFAEMIAAFFIPDPDEQQSESDKWSLILTCMGVGVLLVVGIMTFCFTTMGARLTFRIRWGGACLSTGLVVSRKGGVTWIIRFERNIVVNACMYVMPC